MRLVLAGTALFAALLSGCGTQSADPRASAGDTTAADPSTAAPPTPTPTASAGSGKAPSVDVPAILDFSATTVAGTEFDGASLAGRPSVLWFWAPWCPTCRGQIDGVSSLVEEYGDEVGFVGVGSLDDASAIEGFAGDVPARMPHLLDPDGSVWRHFGVVEQSTYVVLDADSEVVSEGYLDDAALKDLVSDLAG